MCSSMLQNINKYDEKNKNYDFEVMIEPKLTEFKCHQFSVFSGTKIAFV